MAEGAEPRTEGLVCDKDNLVTIIMNDSLLLPSASKNFKEPAMFRRAFGLSVSKMGFVRRRCFFAGDAEIYFNLSQNVDLTEKTRSRYKYPVPIRKQEIYDFVDFLSVFASGRP